MARIILNNGEAVELVPTGPTTLGSGAECGVCLDAQDVAELHCAVKPLKGGGFGIKDLGSKEGTRVNGRTIRAARLRHGDVIEVGTVRISYEDAEAAAAKSQESNPRAERQTELEEKRPPSTSPVDNGSSSGSDAESEAAAETPANGLDLEEDRMPTDTGTLPAGTRIGGYEIQGLLGHGGMGTVYKALQLSLHREVALKVLRQELAEDESFVLGFIEEARHAAKFNHPNVIQVFDVDQDQGRPFFSMELLMQGSLEEQLRREGRIDTTDAIRSMRDAARGLAYAEQLGVVHRDIKPDNLMVTSDGVTKICDLGLAGDAGMHAKKKIAGTPHFISPEQIRKGVVDHRSDIYSLGCSFYRILTGRNPYPHKTVREILKAHLEDEVPSLLAVLPDASPDLDAIIHTMMAKNPEQRFQHASEVADLLDEHFHPISAAAAAAAKEGHKRLLIGMAVIVVVLVIGMAYVLSQSNGTTKIEVTKDDPEKAKREKELRETKARLALAEISTKGTLLDRAARHEELAERYPDSAAAVEAKRIAKALREEHADNLRKQAAAKQREVNLAALVTAETQKLLKSGAYLQAWQDAGKPAGKDRDLPLVKAAIGEAKKSVLTALGAKLDKSLAKLEGAFGDKDRPLSDVERLFLDELPLRETPAKQLPKELRALIDGARAKSVELLAKEGALRKKSRKARLASMLARRGRILAESLQLCRSGELLAAKKKLEAQKAEAGFKAAWAGLERFAKLLGVAAAHETAVVKARQKDGEACSLSHADSTFFVEAYDAGTIVLESASGKKEERVKLPLWQSPQLCGQLFAKRKGVELGKENDEGRRALLFVAGLLFSVDKAESFFAQLQNGSSKHTSKIGGPLCDALLAEDWPQGQENPEIWAVLELCRLLAAWDKGADLAASRHASRLEQLYGNTVVAILLGIAASSSGGK